MKILVIDDQIGAAGGVHQRAFLRAYTGLSWDFMFESCSTSEGYSATKATGVLRKNPDIDLVLLDIKFGTEDNRLGFEILPQLTKQFPSVPVLIMSSVDRDIEALGRCLEDGAVGFIAKEQRPDAFQRIVSQTLSMARSHALLGQSLPLRELRRQAARLSPYDQVPVMICGARGTGKERLARYIHHNGPRTSGPFVAVNCAGLAETLLDAELFGAEQGAYTDAKVTRIGYLERANGGVLFLDEIANMPLFTQAKLLRALQDKSFRRVGVTEREVVVDFQIISATNEEPEELIRQKRLREDFFDRIAAVTIRTPLLCDCRSDIPELTEHFLTELDVQGRKRLSSEVLNAFARYTWPGNIRELRRIVQQAVVVSENSSVLRLEHLPLHVRGEDQPNRADRTDCQHLRSEVSQSWQAERLIAELRLAIAAKEAVRRYKGRHWKAEFMRLMYPECKAQNAKGFRDLVRRLTKGPWGSPTLRREPETAQLLRQLEE